MTSPTTDPRPGSLVAVQMVPPARFKVGDEVGLVLDAARLWPLGDAG